MPKTDISEYRLSPQAEADLAEIWIYSAELWGADQADRYLDTIVGVFDLLVAMPEMGREDIEFRPPVRIHPSAEHVIVYLIEGDHLAIIRILAARQNWQVLVGES